MKFRKKPVVIEAMQFDGSHSSAEEIIEWVNKATGFISGRVYYIFLRETRNGAIRYERCPVSEALIYEEDRRDATVVKQRAKNNAVYRWVFRVPIGTVCHNLSIDLDNLR